MPGNCNLPLLEPRGAKGGTQPLESNDKQASLITEQEG